MMQRLAIDESIIGKVPNVRPDQYEQLFVNWSVNEQGLISWHMFAEGCNQWQWRMLEKSNLQGRINNYFTRAQKLKMQGKEDQSRDEASKALRLEGAMSSI